jgi:hypothetical protein
MHIIAKISMTAMDSLKRLESIKVFPIELLYKGVLGKKI